MTTTADSTLPDISVPETAMLSPQIVKQSPLLRVRGLTKHYGAVKAVDGVDVNAYAGEVLGIVVLRLMNLEESADAGEYRLDAPDFEVRNLFELDRAERRKVRTFHIGIVYQHPHLGLRMRNTSSGNVAERLIVAGSRVYGDLREAARQSLAASEFPLSRMDDAPHKLSGGMQQRVQLAKAIALKPRLLLLDEPTTGLDVSVQALVLDTLRRLQHESGITMVIVSHDLGVIRMLADRVMVMRNGRVVETGLTDQVLEDPQHPYTQQLVHAKL